MVAMGENRKDTVMIRISPEVRRRIRIECAKTGLSYNEWLKRRLKELGYWEEEDEESSH
jgi:predicted HicB family RNase H-like nuclease